MAEYNIPKFNKSNVEKFLAYGLKRNDLKFTRLVEEPTVWKHSCVKTGVVVLPSTKVVYPSGEVILFSYCEHCGKVSYYSEFFN